MIGSKQTETLIIDTSVGFCWQRGGRGSSWSAKHIMAVAIVIDAETRRCARRHAHERNSANQSMEGMSQSREVLWRPIPFFWTKLVKLLSGASLLGPMVKRKTAEKTVSVLVQPATKPSLSLRSIPSPHTTCFHRGEISHLRSSFFVVEQIIENGTKIKKKIQRMCDSGSWWGVRDHNRSEYWVRKRKKMDWKTAPWTRKCDRRKWKSVQGDVFIIMYEFLYDLGF